ncbi:MAG: hypothetical protein ACJ77N_12975 [Chloroflexota bacterium]
MLDVSSPFVEIHCPDGGLLNVVLADGLVGDMDVADAVMDAIVAGGPELDETRRGLEMDLEPLGLMLVERPSRHGLVLTVTRIASTVG